MKRETFTAWITKYALTDGIEVVEAELCSDISGTMISYSASTSIRLHAHGNDWHRTPEAALKRAEEMRIAKLALLKKNMAKIERMTFVAPAPKYERA